MQVKDLYAAVKRTAPNLCDDSISPCPYCKQKHPLWQHQTAWALQYLKIRRLAHSPKRGFWEVTTTIVTEPPPAPQPIEESLHKRLKRKIEEIGTILGKYAKAEYPAPPYVYDVVWKEVEGLPRPCHVFEVFSANKKVPAYGIQKGDHPVVVNWPAPITSFLSSSSSL